MLDYIYNILVKHPRKSLFSWENKETCPWMEQCGDKQGYHANDRYLWVSAFVAGVKFVTSLQIVVKSPLYFKYNMGSTYYLIFCMCSERFIKTVHKHQ